MTQAVSRWLPQSLFGRLMGVLAAGLMLAQVLSAAIHVAEAARKVDAQSEALNRYVADFVRSVREELERLAKTVDSFLLLTRVRHGKLQVASTEGLCVTVPRT